MQTKIVSAQTKFQVQTILFLTRYKTFISILSHLPKSGKDEERECRERGWRVGVEEGLVMVVRIDGRGLREEMCWKLSSNGSYGVGEGGMVWVDFF